MSIERKKKICGGCNTPQFIWRSKTKSTPDLCKNCVGKQDGKPIKKVSDSKKQDDKVYKTLRAVFLGSKKICEAALPGCTHWATEVHHMDGRVGHNYLYVKRWLAACRNCHDWIENNPVAAKERGLSGERLKTTTT